MLGCGVIAYWAHLRVLRRMPGATLAAAADPDPAARASARRLTGVELYERAEDLLRRSDIDAVVICAPTQCHADLAVAAAGAGSISTWRNPSPPTPRVRSAWWKRRPPPA